MLLSFLVLLYLFSSFAQKLESPIDFVLFLVLIFSFVGNYLLDFGLCFGLFVKLQKLCMEIILSLHLLVELRELFLPLFLLLL